MIEIIRHKIERCLIYFRPGRSFAYKVISGPWLPAARCKTILPFLCATHIYQEYFNFTNWNFDKHNQQLYNMTKYSRLRLTAKRDLRETWDWPERQRWSLRALDKFHQTDRQPLAFLELLTEPKIYLVKHEMKSHAIYVEFVRSHTNNGDSTSLRTFNRCIKLHRREWQKRRTQHT